MPTRLVQTRRSDRSEAVPSRLLAGLTHPAKNGGCGGDGKKVASAAGHWMEIAKDCDPLLGQGHDLQLSQLHSLRRDALLRAA